jgi:hypothetical protein
VNPRASVGTSTSLTGNTRLRARALSGNRWSALNEAFYTVTTPAAPGDIVFSEIHYHPQGDDDSEFIELWNPTTHAVNLRGTKFTTGIGYDFPDNRDTLTRAGRTASSSWPASIISNNATASTSRRWCLFRPTWGRRRYAHARHQRWDPADFPAVPRPRAMA